MSPAGWLGVAGHEWKWEEEPAVDCGCEGSSEMDVLRLLRVVEVEGG